MSEQDIMHDLIGEFKIQRDAIMGMISDLEGIKKNIDRLIPEQLDARYVRFFEEKVRSITELFKTLLDMRKEITKNLKDEIDLRRRLEIKDTLEDIEKIIDIRGLAGKVEQFKKRKDKIKLQSIKDARKATDEISSKITALSKREED